MKILQKILATLFIIFAIIIGLMFIFSGGLLFFIWGKYLGLYFHFFLLLGFPLAIIKWDDIKYRNIYLFMGFLGIALIFAVALREYLRGFEPFVDWSIWDWQFRQIN